MLFMIACSTPRVVLRLCGQIGIRTGLARGVRKVAESFGDRVRLQLGEGRSLRVLVNALSLCAVRLVQFGMFGRLVNCPPAF